MPLTDFTWIAGGNDGNLGNIQQSLGSSYTSLANATHGVVHPQNFLHKLTNMISNNTKIIISWLDYMPLAATITGEDKQLSTITELKK